VVIKILFEKTELSQHILKRVHCFLSFARAGISLT
jgi:hypothetical protein